jgi:hypothetical protein
LQIHAHTAPIGKDLHTRQASAALTGLLGIAELVTTHNCVVFVEADTIQSGCTDHFVAENSALWITGFSGVGSGGLCAFTCLIITYQSGIGIADPIWLALIAGFVAGIAYCCIDNDLFASTSL